MGDTHVLRNLINYPRQFNNDVTPKMTLRQHAVEMVPPPDMESNDVVDLRQRLNFSRALFARCLRTNIRTLENWEQGRAKPNAQAVLLMRMVELYPDTILRLADI